MATLLLLGAISSKEEKKTGGPRVFKFIFIGKFSKKIFS